MVAITLTNIAVSSLPIPGEDPWFADPGDPAMSVMTDFRDRASVTVGDGDSIDTALQHMKHAGVRSAFAVDHARGLVVGFVTAYDIMGEKPMSMMRPLSTPRSEFLVRDLMQPVRDWRVVDMREIERATVESVARLFEVSGLTHIPVIEADDKGGRRLRGLLSAARVKRLLQRHDRSHR
jgi:CBS domain-containing protein